MSLTDKSKKEQLLLSIFLAYPVKQDGEKGMEIQAIVAVLVLYSAPHGVYGTA